MSQYEELKKRLKPTPYLIADHVDGTVELVDQSTALDVMVGAGPFPTEAVVDLAKALEGFCRLKAVGKVDREFRLREICKIAGMSYHLAYHYMQRGVLVPSIRPASGSGTGDVEARFSWEDAFIAGVVGSLRRNGIRKMEQLKAVRDLLSSSKQTAQRMAPAKRS